MNRVKMPTKCGRYLWHDEEPFTVWVGDHGDLLANNGGVSETVEDMDAMLREEMPEAWKRPWLRVCGECGYDECRGHDSILLVTEKATRPAGKDGFCFYCSEPVGGSHKADCPLVQKKVRVRLIAEYDIWVPAFWQEGDLEFHRNEGSFCATNALDELIELAGPDPNDPSEPGCLCEHIRFEHVSEDPTPLVRE